MQKYKVKPINSTDLTKISVEDLYISPDKTFLSGVTDHESGLSNGDNVLISTSSKNSNGVYEVDRQIATVKVKEVLRQGKVCVKVTIPIKTIEKSVYLPILVDNSGGYFYYKKQEIKKCENCSGESHIFTSITQQYVEYNGNISYFFNSSESNKSGYIVNGRFYNAKDDDKNLTIDDYVYIEDGYINIFGKEFKCFFDIKVNIATGQVFPFIRHSKYEDFVEPGGDKGILYKSDDITYELADIPKYVVDYEVKDWKRVQKFTIENITDTEFVVENVLGGSYEHYVIYGGEQYWAKYYVNSGYGVIINDVFYEISYNSNDYTSNNLYYDIDYGYDTTINLKDGEIEVDDDGIEISTSTELLVYSVPMVKVGGTSLIYLIAKSEELTVVENTIIEAKGYVKDGKKILVSYDENGVSFITFAGERYDIIKDAFTVAIVGEFEYFITFIDDNNGYIDFGDGDLMYLKIEEIPNADGSISLKATPQNKVYYEYEEKSKTYLRYGIKEKAYDVVKYDGVIINDNVYKVQKEYSYVFDNSGDENGNSTICEESPVETEINEDNLPYTEYVQVNEEMTFNLEVLRVIGSSTFLCSPLVDSNDMTPNDAESERRWIIDEIVSNSESFTFSIKKVVFGREKLMPEISLVESMSCKHPITVSGVEDLYESFTISKLISHISLRLPMTPRISHNLMAEDIVNNVFVDYVKSNSLNDIVDMEKDIYHPVISYNGNFDIENCNNLSIKRLYQNECDDEFTLALECVDNNLTAGESRCNYIFNDVDEVRFNLHFRTRDLDTWKIYDETTYDNDMTNWFITDYAYYKIKINGSDAYYGGNNTTKDRISNDVKQNSSDLLGLMNFTTSEVFNQAKKIPNSFLRVSLYSTDDPNTQVLLGTSSIYIDSNKTLGKYMALSTNKALKYHNVKDFQLNNGVSPTDEFTVLSEVFGNNELYESLRMDSRLTVKDRDKTEKSSEGFYHYIYKEYSSGLRENVVYARFEFNHAGLGQTLQMMIPRDFSAKIEDYPYGKPLYIHDTNDLKKMKEGFSMGNIYKQLHFPLHVKFDIESNRYVYWIDESLMENDELGVPKNIMEFNLFEIKFKDES